MQTFNQLKNRRAKKTLGQELLVTSLLTAMGTAALVGIHHRYRKRHQRDVSVQDYVTGIRFQFHLLPSISKQQLTRFRYVLQQTTTVWQHTGHTASLADNDSNNIINTTIDPSTDHITTMWSRPVCWVSGVASMPKNTALVKEEYLSNTNDFGVVGIDADRQIVWQTTMPERVHDIVVQPVVHNENEHGFDNSNSYKSSNQSRDVVVMGRRPSENFWVLDTATGQVKTTISASLYRHFYGHACYSLDGSKLYVTENDTISLNGKIGVYNAYDNYKKIAEFDSHGIGPHELIMHPDGKTLVIANGGIKTEQASREELNLDTMCPSLVYLDPNDGSLLEQIMPEHNQMSVRHLDIHDDGTVMVGIQFQGERHLNVPLVLTHKRGEADFRPLVMPNDQWQRFHQYIASVAVDSKRNRLCVTTPIGGCAAIFDLNTRALIDTVSLPDCAGAAVITDKISNQHEKSGFMVSDGQGQLTTLRVNNVSTASLNSSHDKERVLVDSLLHRMSFDNHLQALL